MSECELILSSGDFNVMLFDIQAVLRHLYFLQYSNFLHVIRPMIHRFPNMYLVTLSNICMCPLSGRIRIQPNDVEFNQPLGCVAFFPHRCFSPLTQTSFCHLAVAQHLWCVFQSFPKALIMFFHCFSHRQKMLPLWNLMPIVDLGNLNPCMFWCNSCVLKLT